MLLPRATHRYQSIRDPPTALRMRMRELAQARIRYGYRKLRVLLIRDGWQVGKKLVYRLHRGEIGESAEGTANGLGAKSSEPWAEGPNQVWAWIFVADQLSATAGGFGR